MSIKTGDLKRPPSIAPWKIFLLSPLPSQHRCCFETCRQVDTGREIYNISSTLSIAGKWSRTSTIAIIPNYSYFFFEYQDQFWDCNFSAFFLILSEFLQSLLNEYLYRIYLLNWMNIFLNEYFWFCFDLSHFQAWFNEKWNFKKDRPPLNPAQ